MNEQVELTDLQYKQLSDIICQRISAGEKVRRTLPGGRIHIDRQLPFICIYRKPEKAKDEGTYRLVMGEASYLVCTGNKREFKNLSNLVYEVVKTLSREFGGFLVLEIWSSKSKITKKNDKRQLLQPVFHLSSSELEYGPLKSTTDKLADTL